MRGKHLIALVLSLFALAAVGCGGDDEDDAATTVPTIPLSVPGEETTLEDEDATDTTVDTTAEPAPTPAPAPAPAPTPAPPVQTPDSPENDTPPPPGSEAEQFEEFCAENPGAC